MAQLYVQLLANAGIRLKNEWQPFRAEKPYQLLAYLAYQQDWVNREHLAFLFWSDLSDEAARRNLRKTIFKLRRLNLLQTLDIEHGRLRWQVDTDVARFCAALRAEAWQEATTLYGGSLLHAIDIGVEGEFATWLALERSRLHSLYREAVFRYAEERKSQGKRSEVLPPLEKLLELDEFDEEALRMLLSCLVEAGSYREAQRVYDSFSQNLKRELNLEPNTETRLLIARLEQPPVQLAEPIVTPLPTFIGRTLERQELQDLLRQPDCRLLTLLGPGGVGKTRVALQTTQSINDRFQDGSHVVLLETLNKPDLIIPKIIESLGLSLQGVREPLEYLKHYLANKQLLLLLDNFEHLVSSANLLSELLTACPGLKLLVTSRERLKLEQEWLLPLEGLNYPKDKDVTLEEALSHDAVQLFVARARRLQPHFSLTQADVKPLVEVCRLVDGFPLGLELAASWVRHLSLSDIAQEIQTNTDFLQSQNRNMSERHQSLRATFEHSWDLLADKEREVLAKLSVFRGGFNKEAAVFVVDAPLPLLTGLVDKSLLRVESGRYDFHELIRQYAAEKLREKERKTILDRHASFYAEFVAIREKDAKGGAREVQVLDELELELSNIRLAWQYAVAQSSAKFFEKMMPTLPIFYIRRHHIREAEEAMRSAAGSLKDGVTRGRLLSFQAFFKYHFSSNEALPLAEQGLAMLEKHRAKPGVLGLALWHLSVIHQHLGQSSLAERYARESLEYNRQADNSFQAARSLLALSQVLHKRDALGAERFLREAIAYFRKAHDKWGLGLALEDLGNLLAKEQRFAEAKAAQEECIRVYSFFGQTQNLADSLTEYGITLCAEGNYQEALESHERSLAIHRDYHTPQTFYPLKHLGETYLALGEAQKALEYFQEAFHFAVSFDHDQTLAILCGMAEALAQLSEIEKAVTLASFVGARADSDVSQRAKVLLERLEPMIAEPTLQIIQERTASWQWAEVEGFVSSLQR